MARSERSKAWLETLKVRAAAISLRDWEALAFEAYERLTGRPPLAVTVEAHSAKCDAATVYVIGDDGARLCGFYSPESVSGLELVVSCQGCWRDVLLKLNGSPEIYARQLDRRQNVYCCECVRI